MNTLLLEFAGRSAGSGSLIREKTLGSSCISWILTLSGVGLLLLLGLGVKVWIKALVSFNFTWLFAKVGTGSINLGFFCRLKFAGKPLVATDSNLKSHSICA